MDYVPRHLLETAFRRLGPARLRERLHALRALAEVRGVRYVDDSGRPRAIEIGPIPWVLTSAQLLSFHRAIHLLAEALVVLPHLYARLPAVREVIRFDARQRSWLGLTAHPRARPLAVIGRMDSTATFGHPAWRTDFRMLEPNAVGVGGVHYAPAACSVVMDVFGDVLSQALAGRVITASPDPRRILLGELRLAQRRLRRPLRAVALIENADFTTGTDEFQELARHLTRVGLRAVVADPRQLTRRGDQLSVGRTPVDLLYRDSELGEFIEMESAGHRLTALRQAIREGRLISGLTWEFDQKSAWEIFTDPRYAGCFSAAQRRFFRAHLLWTRLVRAATVSDPSGRPVDLPAFIRRHRTRLVLKPNTLFGGEGVVLGRLVTQRDWERELARALTGRQRYVVQQLATVFKEAQPVLMDDGVRTVSRYVVSGFFFSSTEIGLVGRFSSGAVVNVSQGGGLIPALWVH